MLRAIRIIIINTIFFFFVCTFVFNHAAMLSALDEMVIIIFCDEFEEPKATLCDPMSILPYKYRPQI